MKPTEQMINSACVAYVNCETMGMTARMSDALEAALAAMWEPVKAAWVNGEPGTTRTMVFDPNGRIIFIGWGVSYHHVPPSSTDSE
jgi:hypothetical protein